MINVRPFDQLRVVPSIVEGRRATCDVRRAHVRRATCGLLVALCAMAAMRELPDAQEPGVQQVTITLVRWPFT